MKPVEQTKFSYPDGNCFAACVASILELSLDEVPDFRGDDWFEQWQEWLAARNLYLVYLGLPGYESWKPKGYSIANGLCGGVRHALVCYDGEVVWNPHPRRDEWNGAIEDVTLFVALDPSRTARPASYNGL